MAFRLLLLLDDVLKGLVVVQVIDFTQNLLGRRRFRIFQERLFYLSKDLICYGEVSISVFTLHVEALFRNDLMHLGCPVRKLHLHLASTQNYDALVKVVNQGFSVGHSHLHLDLVCASRKVEQVDYH